MTARDAFEVGVQDKINALHDTVVNEYRAFRAQANAEIEAWKRENLRLKALIENGINNAPKDEPSEVSPRTLPQAHSYWRWSVVAGRVLEQLEAVNSPTPPATDSQPPQ